MSARPMYHESSAADVAISNHIIHGGTMSENKKEIVRIELTDEQKKAVREQDASAVEFTVEELEQRIAPRSIVSDVF
jgi:hypothetical protein